jgi:hypothetical protein
LLLVNGEYATILLRLSPRARGRVKGRQDGMGTRTVRGERLRRRRLAPTRLPRAPTHAEDGPRPGRRAGKTGTRHPDDIAILVGHLPDFSIPANSTSVRFLRAPHRPALHPGAGCTLDAFAPRGYPRGISRDPERVATARGVRPSPGRRCSTGPFPLVKSDRESPLPAGSRRFAPSRPPCRGSPTVRTPRRARRA